MESPRPGPTYFLLMALSWILGLSFVICSGNQTSVSVASLVFGAAILAAVGAVAILPPEARRGRISEVIVSGLVIAVVSAIFIPVSRASASVSSRTNCFSNVKQLAMCLSEYALDYDDRLPLSDTWYDGLNAYLRGTNHRCLDATAPYTYAFNSALSGLAQSKIKNPDWTVAIFECNAYAPNPAGGAAWFVRRHDGRGLTAVVSGYSKTSDGASLIWKP